MSRKKQPKVYEEDICECCHSYSGIRNGNGWCMRLRKATKSNDTCGLWN